MKVLPDSRIPWLRGVGAVGTVAALVVGGAVTTAGAIDSPGGAEPATVQFMATDADGNWYSCDIDVDLPEGDGAAIAISAAGRPGDPSRGSFSIVAGAVPAGAVQEGDGAAGGSVGGSPGVAGAVPAVGMTGPPVAIAGGGPGQAAIPPDGGVETVHVGELPELPRPEDVRPGTPEECSGVSVGVAAVPLPAVPVEAVPGVEAGTSGQTEG